MGRPGRRLWGFSFEGFSFEGYLRSVKVELVPTGRGLAATLNLSIAQEFPSSSPKMPM